MITNRVQNSEFIRVAKHWSRKLSTTPSIVRSSSRYFVVRCCPISTDQQVLWVWWTVASNKSVRQSNKREKSTFGLGNNYSLRHSISNDAIRKSMFSGKCKAVGGSEKRRKREEEGRGRDGALALRGTFVFSFHPELLGVVGEETWALRDLSRFWRFAFHFLKS